MLHLITEWMIIAALSQPVNLIVMTPQEEKCSYATLGRSECIPYLLNSLTPKKQYQLNLYLNIILHYAKGYVKATNSAISMHYSCCSCTSMVHSHNWPNHKRWRLYFLPQYLANLTLPVGTKKPYAFGKCIPVITTPCTGAEVWSC